MLGVRSLRRTFADQVALDDVSFEVVPGRITGFIGANGAGKTTTMRIIMGVLAADFGEVWWDDTPVEAKQRRDFGYMPEERGLYPAMKVLDQLVFFARLHGLGRDEADRRARALLASLDLSERIDDRLETLSLGNAQRVQIAAALVHKPTALVLDEPFSGLDPLAVEHMVGLLRDEVGDPVPVLFSSHQLELVERICDDLVILSAGRVVAAGSADQLRHQGPARLRVVFAEDVARGAAAKDAATVVRDLRDVQIVDVDGDTAVLELSEPYDEGHQAELLAALVARAPVREFARVVRPLSEVFMDVTR